MTTESDGQPDPLHRLASEFAASLAATLDAVLDGVPPITAEVRPGKNPRISVAPRDLEDAEHPNATIPLLIDGKHRLSLRIEMFCAWDTSALYLTVDESKIALEVPDSRAHPLVRFEYDRHRPVTLPAAHVHVHAHRDEIVYLMGLPSRGRPKERVARGSMPILSELHIPVGGHRFRPCLEDVLELAITEFGVQPRAGWQHALHDGRADWRRKQTAAAARDCPVEAADALVELGWTVTPPTDQQNRAERRDRLTAF